MRKLLSVLLAVVLAACVTVAAAGAAQTDTAAEAAGIATVTLYDLKGGSVTQTYSVGETFTAYTYLNINGIGNSRIGSISGEQTYTSSVLTIADEYDNNENSFNYGLVYDVDTMFPVIGSGTIANARIPGYVHYNASTPSIYGGFLFNKDDSALIVVHYTVTAPGKATIANSLNTLAQADYALTAIIDGGVIVNDALRTSTALSKPTLPVDAFTVSGTVTSFTGNAGSDTVTVALVQGDTVVSSFEGKGNSVAYKLENVESGDYILRVSKANHVTRDYNITVNGDVKADAKIHLLGDVTGDGRITTADYSRVNSHARGVSIITDDYLYRCADVIGSDGKVTTADAARINSHARGVAYLW